MNAGTKAGPQTLPAHFVFVLTLLVQPLTLSLVVPGEGSCSSKGKMCLHAYSRRAQSLPLAFTIALAHSLRLISIPLPVTPSLHTAAALVTHCLPPSARSTRAINAEGRWHTFSKVKTIINSYTQFVSTPTFENVVCEREKT